MKGLFPFFIAVSLAAPAVAGGGDGGGAGKAPSGASVTARAQPTLVTVGDRIFYRLAVVAPASASVSFPAVGSALGDFRVRDLGKTSVEELDGGLRRQSRLYRMAVYKTGDTFIPSMTVTLRDAGGKTSRMDSGPVAVRVKSVLDKDAVDIRDIKGPLDIPYVSSRYYLWGLIAAAIAAALLIARKRRRWKPPPPPPPPHALAYEELRRILAMNLVARGRVKEYFIRLSGTVRRYVERRFGLRAPERTTEEFLEEARISGLLDARARTLVGDFLERSDMVKFARYGPTEDECGKAYASAKRFVDETKINQPAAGAATG